MADGPVLEADLRYVDPRGRAQHATFALGSGRHAVIAEEPAALLAAVAGAWGGVRGHVRIAGVEALCDGHATGGGRHAPLGWLPDPDVLVPAWTVARNVGIARGVRGAADRVGDVAAALELGDHWRSPVGRIAPRLRRRVQLARALVAGCRVLLVDVAAGTPADERRDLAACLAWAEAARGSTVLAVARSSADLDADVTSVLVLQDGVTHGPGPLDVVLGRSLRGGLAERFEVASVLPAVVDYLDEEGRWLRVLVGSQEVHMPFVRLSPGWRGVVAVRADSVLVLREPIAGPRLTNQLRGRVVAVGDLLGRCRVDVDVGAGDARIRALVEPDTVRELGLTDGTPVVVVFEPAAVRWGG